MSVARICSAIAAVALLLVFLLPGSANAGWHHRHYNPHDFYPVYPFPMIYAPLQRLYAPYPWGFPEYDLGSRYPMYGKWYGHVRRYYYALPPYWDCCW
jgi:hypothetical protein